jgi:hypothetical protein
METEKEWISKTGKHYVSWFEPEENVPHFKLSDYATLQLENKTAYVSDLKWSRIVREYARAHGMDEIRIVLRPHKPTRNKRGRPPKASRNAN